MRTILRTIAILLFAGVAVCKEVSITDYGATPNDGTDDTQAILAALDAGRGDVVTVPAGAFTVVRQRTELPILSLPSNTTLRGEGDASCLQFAPEVNDTNFWAMLGANGPCENVRFERLRLNGANTHEDQGQCHGFFFRSTTGPIRNVEIEDVTVEQFRGDCVDIRQGCDGVLIRNVRMRDYRRQGILLAGGGNIVVRECEDFASNPPPHGSTLHIEDTIGFTGAELIGNTCHHSIVASDCQDVEIRRNVVHGMIGGARAKRLTISNNSITESPGNSIQFSYSDWLWITGNESNGGYSFSGVTRYDDTPSQRIVVERNWIGGIIRFDGAETGLVAGNDPAPRLIIKRSSGVRSY